jgi:hypothetical protein
MAEERSVKADPTPEPTGEAKRRLFFQLQADKERWEKAGMPEQAAAVQKRLDALGDVEAEAAAAEAAPAEAPKASASKATKEG